MVVKLLVTNVQTILNMKKVSSIAIVVGKIITKNAMRRIRRKAKKLRQENKLKRRKKKRVKKKKNLLKKLNSLPKNGTKEQKKR